MYKHSVNAEWSVSLVGSLTAWVTSALDGLVLEKLRRGWRKMRGNDRQARRVAIDEA